MNPVVVALIVAAVLGAAALLGALWRNAQGRARAPREVLGLDPAELGIHPLGASATLLQFSTVFCSNCPGTRRLLREVATRRDGVVHREIDLTDRGELAAQLHILQTPTTFVLDAGGQLVSRIGGPPRRDELAAVLDALTRPLERQRP